MSRRGDQLVITNRRARHDYLVLETWECGIVLEGAEVKSLRNGRANLQDAYARVEDGEVWLYGMHVSPYEFSRGDLDPVRRRKLLLHHKEIVDLDRFRRDLGRAALDVDAWQPSERLGQPPVAIAEQFHRRGHEDHAHDR